MPHAHQRLERELRKVRRLELRRLRVVTARQHVLRLDLAAGGRRISPGRREGGVEALVGVEVEPCR